MILKLTSFLSGIFHSALPCTLLILFSMILLIFLRKVRRERAVVILQKGSREAKDRERTTTLLMCILISTMISEIPQGIFFYTFFCNKCCFSDIEFVRRISLIKNASPSYV
ncbi:hypothetical protein PRIPAC_82027 [Pristionchus pacificus]|nr:hypothetical protein PRIPAC_82027 [Pristionchus pacificus]